MRVFILPPDVPSHALSRVMNALAEYHPSHVEIVPDLKGADLVILNVIGRQDRVYKRADKLKAGGQRYAVVQYCLRSTLRPDTGGWLPLWRDAALVWSYYDLPALCAEDGLAPDFTFYHAPLGVDAAVFRPYGVDKQFVIATSGHAALAEGVREAAHAAGRVGRQVFHLGPELKLGPHVICASGMDDVALANLFSRCEFVSGLRRTEGFELPAAEGLLCGARPVLFDRPHYRQWYGPWAEFIPEGPREQVVDSLEVLFRAGVTPVAGAERRAAAERFDWETILTGFWEKLWTCLC